MRASTLCGLLGLALFAACADPASERGPRNPDDHTDDDTDTGPVDDRVLVDVSHERELRGAWVATVWNINFPSSSSLSADAQKAQLESLLDTMASFGLNAVFFQVRPESDALYASELEPWSRVLTGTQGADPGYDPLATLIELAHPRNIEVHAWINPYRAKASNSNPIVAPHIALSYPQYAYEYGSGTWMDPGAEVVRDHVIEVVADIVRRYDIDGIHLDDYFYPYPISGTPFPDDATWNAYVASGGTMSRADWRRDNVNRMIELLDLAVAAESDHVRFGISPFGIYKPGEPEGITGLNQYESLYADPVKWIQEGWVDYLAPQLYWPTTQTAQAYGTLLPWWAQLSDEGRYIFAGNYLSQLGTSSAWTVDEFRQQVTLSRSYRHLASKGNIFYNVNNVLTDHSGVASMLRDEFYAGPALTPPLFAMREVAVSPPWVEVDGAEVVLTHDEPDALRAWVVYADDGDDWVIDRIVPAQQSRVALPTGTWAISAASRFNVESRGVVVEVE